MFRTLILGLLLLASCLSAKPPVYVVLWFDTEDYLEPAADGKYHLGFIRTQQEFQWVYYEARANLDTVPGYWSAFWLWGKHS